MNTDFDYEIVPHGYAHCFNDNCSKASSCLRHWVAQHCTANVPLITILSPACFPATSVGCAYFAPIRKMRVAWGVKTSLVTFLTIKPPMSVIRLLLTLAVRTITESIGKNVLSLLKTSKL